MTLSLPVSVCVCVQRERITTSIDIPRWVQSMALYSTSRERNPCHRADLIPTDLLLEFLPFKLLVLLALLHFKLTDSSLSPLVYPGSPSFYSAPMSPQLSGGKLRVVLGSFHGAPPCLYSNCKLPGSPLWSCCIWWTQVLIFLTWVFSMISKLVSSPPGSPIHILSSFHTSTVLIPKSATLSL